VTRRSRAGGTRKRPARYGSPASEPLAIALRAHRKGELGRAVEAYAALVEGDPDCLDAWVNLASVWALLGRCGQAERAAERAIAIAPDDARVHRDVGFALAAVGRLERAHERFAAAVELDPGMVGALLALSRLSGELGDRAAAIAHAHRAVEAAPHDASAHLELHRAAFDPRALGPCIEAGRRAVELDPSHGIARFFLAGALALDGDREAADALLDASLAPGLGDALAHALACEGATYFATTRSTLRFAMDARTLAGPVIELGVRHGVSTRILAQDAPIVHAFDSFEGLPERWHDRPAGSFSTAGELPDLPPNVVVHAGLFDDTLRPFCAALAEAPSLVHVDCDLYSSARSALFALGPHLDRACVIALDEYIGNETWREDEFRALTEAAAHFGWRLTVIGLSWITGQGVVRIE
jgi:Flp pilus assembly protein TadD